MRANEEVSHIITAPRQTYIYDKGNYQGMKDMMTKTNWDAAFQEKSTKGCWQTLLSSLLEAKKKHIPRCMVRSLLIQRKKPLWLIPQALIKVKKKHAAWCHYLETKEGHAYNEYCNARNQAKWATRQALRDYEHNIAAEAKKDPGGFYKYVRGKTNTKSGIGDLEANGRVAQSDEDKAGVLNSFFASVFTKEDASELPDFPDRGFHDILDTLTFSPPLIKKKLLKLNPTKSPDPDGLHPRILRELSDELAYPLSLLFTRLLQEGVVPSSWREACITPIYKKGGKKEPGNYRPSQSHFHRMQTHGEHYSGRGRRTPSQQQLSCK